MRRSLLRLCNKASSFLVQAACTWTHVFLPLLLFSSSMPVRAAYVKPFLMLPVP